MTPIYLPPIKKLSRFTAVRHMANYKLHATKMHMAMHYCELFACRDNIILTIYCAKFCMQK